jgi:SAM-dependent methyltransferase
LDVLAAADRPLTGTDRRASGSNTRRCHVRDGENTLSLKHAAAAARLAIRPYLWDMFQRVVGTNAAKTRAVAPYVSRPGSILEIGCATGNLARSFRDFSYTGVDTDAACIRLASRRFRQPNFRFHCIDLLEEALPVGQPFDYVLISHTAHHLADDGLRRLIRRSFELLKEGGELVVLDMIRPDPTEPFKKQLYYRLDREVLPDLRVSSILRGEGSFPDPSLHVVKTRKWGIEVVDQVVIHARRHGG